MTAAAPGLVVVARPGGPGLAPGGHAEWRRLSEARLELAPTPLERQPSAYVRRAWEGRAHGSVPIVHVAAATAGPDLLVRLRWPAATPHIGAADINAFADACALLFPLDGRDADLASMGSESRPVCGWHWRAGAESAFVVTARGLGTVEREPGHGVTAAADWAAGEWRVVFRRPLAASIPELARGGDVPFAVAVWSGADEERAGLKAHTPAWHRLAVAAEEA